MLIQKTMRLLQAALILALPTVALCAEPEDKRFTVESQVVAPAYAQGIAYTVSARGLHVGTVVPVGSRRAVSIDGVVGPEFDEILNAAVAIELQYSDRNQVLSQSVKWNGAVAFSPDGTRYAYAARTGEQVVVICDGKEIFRAPASSAAPPVQLISFSPDGKHLIFYSHTSDTMQSYCIVVDGERTVAFDQTPYVFFSPDGAHWGLLAGHAKNPQDRLLLIDGKDAGYALDRARFTADNRVMGVRVHNDSAQEEFVVDGKSVLTGKSIDTFAASPAGDQVACVALNADDVRMLYINGHPAAGTEFAGRLLAFSPDGKHWAVACYKSPTVWYVVDGRRSAEYGGVQSLAFSPDSSRFIAVVESNNQRFVVVDGLEHPGNAYLAVPPTFARTGAEYAYITGSSPDALTVVYDGKVSPVGRRIKGLLLSDDGKRFGYFVENDMTSHAFVLDWETQPGSVGENPRAFISADGKHVATVSRQGNDGFSYFVDGTSLPIARGIGNFSLAGFTADGEHLVSHGQEADAARQLVQHVYINGESVTELHGLGVAGGVIRREDSIEMQADGSVLILGTATAGPETSYGGEVKRIKVTPKKETTIATWADDVTKAAEKATADAEAVAKLKAQEEAQRQADAKAAQEEAARQKAAAREEANRKKTEAIEAKRKTREDALRKKAEDAKRK